MYTLITSKTNSAATTNATLVRTGSANVIQITASNINAAIRYLKIYDKATAPTVGTDTPILTIPIPATGIVNLVGSESGINVSLGLGLAITAAAADSDTTAVAANEIKVLINYF